MGDPFTITFGGDTSLGHWYVQKADVDIQERLASDPSSFFSAVRPALEPSDLTILNLETVLAVNPRSRLQGRKKYLNWDDPSTTVPVLKGLGVHAVSLANNHTMDFGPDVLLSTAEQLHRAGISTFGAGADGAAAERPLVRELPGPGRSVNLYAVAAQQSSRRLREQFGFYAGSATPGVNELAPHRLQRWITRTRADDPECIIVVCPHWGRNYEPVDPAVRELAARLITAGADLVIGHGPHMLQEIESVGVGTCVYSIGNLVFNSKGRYAAFGVAPFSLLAKLLVHVAPDHVAAQLRLYPIVTDNVRTGYATRLVTRAEMHEVMRLMDTGRDSAPAMEAGADGTGHYLSPVGPLSPRLADLRDVRTSTGPGSGMSPAPVDVPYVGLARASARKLASMVQRSGKFVYAYHGATGQPQDGYNYLRHAGSVWAMVSTAPETWGEARRAMDWLEQKYEPMTVGAALASKGRIKLGGNGLAILAHLALGVEHDLGLARRLGDFLLTQQRADGDYHHKVGVDGTVLEFRSEYYTGEIMFGLAALYGATGDSRYLESVLRAEKTLGPSGYGVKEQSHWMLYALEALYQHTRDTSVVTHALAIVRDILDNPAYLRRAESTPAACRTEGLMAGYRLLRCSGADHSAVSDQILQRCALNIQHQLQYRTEDGAFVAGANSDVVRIDYLQHALSGIDAYGRALEDRLGQ
ncbi:MAG: CapA family protein [Actinomycetota bacterium]|nr:CapA family protein [Actinomycetota bacterium]